MTTSARLDSLTSDINVFDTHTLTSLKRQAAAGDPAANKAIAKQFEVLFWQMALKAMRDATPSDGLFDSDQTRMFQSLLDQQLSQSLGSSGGNRSLAAVIEAQLARQNGVATDTTNAGDAPAAATAVKPLAPLVRPAATALSGGWPSARSATTVESAAAVLPAPTFASSSAAGASTASTAESRQAFVSRLTPAANLAAQRTGIPAHFMLAQAALETGWGQAEPRQANGQPSFNVFGIKAGDSWRGATVSASTTEVIAGVAQQRVERFRAYASYTEAFQDYADLLTRNPRYAAVVGAQHPAGFARGLQAAGYATDPQYAAKLERLIGGDALRQALNG
jgi:flagellar protein FlgJ